MAVEEILIYLCCLQGILCCHIRILCLFWHELTQIAGNEWLEVWLWNISTQC